MLNFMTSLYVCLNQPRGHLKHLWRVEISNNVLKSHPTVKTMKTLIGWKEQKRRDKMRNETEEEKPQRLTKRRERDRARNAVCLFFQDKY